MCLTASATWTTLPEVLFMVDPKKEKIAVSEARKLGITTVALLDTNSDPDEIDYVIPANDDAIRAVKLFSSQIADACLEGERRRDADHYAGSFCPQG